MSEVVSVAAGDRSLNGHRFVLDLPAEPLDAEADRGASCARSSAHLVDNAVKFSPDGGTVTVARAAPGRRVEVQRRRRGRRASRPPSSERIFRKFYRGDTSGRGGGTGLGLFIVQGLVERDGRARIWVESAEGEGSSFAFELPLAGAAAALVS